MRRRGLGVALGATLLVGAWPAAAVTQAPIVGEIDFIQVDPPFDRYAGGVMVVGGQNVILPRNLLIDLPANRLTLQDLFDQAPPGCEGTSGLARADACRAGLAGATATVFANRLDSGEVVAGEVFIQKGLEALAGVVTHVDHTQGYFVLNGAPGSSTTGVMVRINEPLGRHTIQTGAGCRPGSNNCSPDERFGVDADNYTAAFTTGYPLCLPSTAVGGARTTGASANGTEDPFCPTENRAISPVPDSTRYAPLQVGDSAFVEGNFETVAGVRFLSAWHVEARAALVTRDSPTQPDYLTLAESEWDAPTFANQRIRFLLIGFTTLPNSPLDVYALHFDEQNGAHEVPVGSTIGNPDTINQGIPPNAGSIFRIRYDVDFLQGADRRSPCANLANAGFNGICPTPPTLASEVAVISPIAREVVARTRRTPLAPGVTAVDLRGRPAPSGEYLSPVGIAYPEFVEIDLGRVATPFSFSGIPWNLDRRLGPGGCEGPCEALPQPLEPFPFEGIDPRTGAPLAANRILAHFPFGPGDASAWPPPVSAPRGIQPTPALPPLCSIVAPVPPTLAAITPAQGPVGSGGTAILTGTGFLPGTTCSLGAGIAAACAVDSPTQLTVVFSIAGDATPGPRDVIVTNTGGTAILPGAFTITDDGVVVGPPPVVTSVTPAQAEPGDVLSVGIAGANFGPNASCDFGPGIAVTFCSALSATELAADLQVDPSAAAGPRVVTITNADGQAATLANGFTVAEPAPPPPPPALLLTSVAPNVGDAGTTLAVGIFGAGFAPGIACSFGPDITVLSCLPNGAGRVDALIEIGTGAAPGLRDVGLALPDGRTASETGAFEVRAPVGAAPLFADAFDTAMGSRWTPRGTWSVTGGTARSGSSLARAVANVTVPTDVVVEARVLLTDADQRAGVIARATGGDFYTAVVRSDRVQLLRYRSGTISTLASFPTTLADNTWTDLKLEVAGTNPVVLEVSHRGIPVIRTTDATAARLVSGGVGIRAGSASAWFDDFRVTLP